MTLRIAGLAFLGLSLLAAGCMTAEEKTAARPGATVSESQAIKAFADSVLGHCLPAIHTGQAFREFELKNVEPLMALQPNKISLFERETPQVWQLAKAVVQLQYEQGSTCEVKAISLPVQTTFKLVGNGVLQTGYRYDEQDTGFPQNGPAFRRVFTSGTGPEAVTVTLTGMEPGAEGNDKPYAQLNALVEKGGE